MEYSELFVVHGETDGASASGTCDLRSDVFRGTVKYIRLPKGSKAKVWIEKVGGEGETAFTLQYARDVTAAPPTWMPLQVVKLASKGELVFAAESRPILVRSTSGKEAISVAWSQPAAVKAYVDLVVEVAD